MAFDSLTKIKISYLCRMMRKSEKGIRWFMLASGFILLLTVIVPHHHHEGGRVCIALSDSEHGSASGEEEHHSDCESAGHTVVFNAPETQSPESHHQTALFILLHTLFDYRNPSQPTAALTGSDLSRAVFIEPLSQVRTPRTTGLRAPPSVL
jgi:zinc transporter ZupT